LCGTLGLYQFEAFERFEAVWLTAVGFCGGKGDTNPPKFWADEKYPCVKVLFEGAKFWAEEPPSLGKFKGFFVCIHPCQVQSHMAGDALWLCDGFLVEL